MAKNSSAMMQKANTPLLTLVARVASSADTDPCLYFNPKASTILDMTIISL
jgi:hypothetical protein